MVGDVEGQARHLPFGPAVDLEQEILLDRGDERFLVLVMRAQPVADRGDQDRGRRQALLTVHHLKLTGAVFRQDDGPEEVRLLVPQDGVGEVLEQIEYVLLLPGVLPLVDRHLQAVSSQCATDAHVLVSD